MIRIVFIWLENVIYRSGRGHGAKVGFFSRAYVHIRAPFGIQHSGIDFALCHIQSAVEAPIFKNR
jgi:hypothetical protein